MILIMRMQPFSAIAVLSCHAAPTPSSNHQTTILSAPRNFQPSTPLSTITTRHRACLDRPHSMRPWQAELKVLQSQSIGPGI